MKDIVFEAGFLLAHSLEKIKKFNNLNPIFKYITEDGKSHTKEYHGPIEKTIEESLQDFHDNKFDAFKGIIAYPVDVRLDDGSLSSAIVVEMLYYVDYGYIAVLQPYSYKDGKIKLLSFEILDTNLENEDLEELKPTFIAGSYQYQNRLIWQ